MINNPLVDATVVRRQSDFNELRQNLVRLYPGVIIPSMPTTPLAKLDPKLLNERKNEFQFFIHELIAHPLLRASELVWDFFSVGDEKQYEQIKLQNSKISTPKEVSQLITLEGQANVAFDSGLVQTCRDIQTGVDQISEEFIK